MQNDIQHIEEHYGNPPSLENHFRGLGSGVCNIYAYKGCAWSWPAISQGDPNNYQDGGTLVRELKTLPKVSLSLWKRRVAKKAKWWNIEHDNDKRDEMDVAEMGWNEALLLKWGKTL
jgi:hypothetical protein